MTTSRDRGRVAIAHRGTVRLTFDLRVSGVHGVHAAVMECANA